MAIFEMIKYHGQTYPPYLPLRIEEIAAHFDVQKISGSLDFSLYTEYSYGKRNLDSALIDRFPAIKMANKDRVPQLWKNEDWASQFAEFIVELVGSKTHLRIIEIHPPFSDYTDLKAFAKNYAIFERIIKTHFSKVEILIENRCGSVYHGGKFILSRTEDIFKLAELVKTEGLGLKMAYDVPQIYTAHKAKTEKQFIRLLEEAKNVRWFIGGAHLWGKRISESGRKVAHCGDLNSYFGDSAIKDSFLRAFKDCFDDGIARKMVLEVNSSNDDLASIVNDLQSAGIQFI